ncbi:MAG: OmpH family outer membrane protein [Bacteroidales bacterium]|nr:OmpH family outer membrane protein [Bacteroidales bacterium]MDD4821373.1 OmpH family outer membrane protein [Bacteroidales bacterium]
MLKKILVVLFCVLTTGSYAQTAELKFGHLDTGTFMESLPETKEVQKKLADLQNKYEAELSKLNEEFNKKYTELATQSDTLPPTIKSRRTQEITELQQKITNFREQAYQDLQTQSESLIAPIKEKVRVAIKDVAAEQGLIYVFEAPALLYYSDKSIDLTPLMKKKFNLQ